MGESFPIETARYSYHQDDTSIYSKGDSDTVIRRLWMRTQSDFFAGGYGPKEQELPLDYLNKIAENIGIDPQPLYMKDCTDGQLMQIASNPVSVTEMDPRSGLDKESDVYLPFDELQELRDLEQILETLGIEYREKA